MGRQQRLTMIILFDTTILTIEFNETSVAVHVFFRTRLGVFMSIVPCTVELTTLKKIPSEERKKSGRL